MLQAIGETLCGFTVTRIRESEELGGRLVELIYDKTGTELCWVDNKQENKLFSIAFKTLPENSTGVFHILEHSVLCGSKKYPVREPFVELLKSSMNTFLNAMTFPDKTMYPVSSRIDRDFLNLTEVYLDAVFAPAILTNPNIFCQEGWHIEEDEDGILHYNGVVFNEMKGALSSVDDLCEYKIQELLFPDTSYGYNSGGDPAVIPSLTYEQFKETYHRFYHPSNARIYLDGAIPVEETLTLIEEYLSQYEKSDDLPQLAMQTPVPAYAEQEYELAQDESPENKTFLTAGKIIGTWQDRAKTLAARVLSNTVCGTNDTPIKRAVLSAGLAQEIDAGVDNSYAQNIFTLQFRNVTDGRAEEILPLVRETAQALLEKGLDRDALEADCNRYEFLCQEPAEPLALDRCINCMNSWLHGGDPMLYLVYRADFAEVHAMIADGRMETLLKEMFIDSDHTAVLLSTPSHTRGEALRKDEADRLAAIRAGWTDADLAENRALNARLAKWQQTPDTPEQLATLPVLPLSAVGTEPAWTETEFSESNGVTVLYHHANCRDIQNIRLYFSMTDLNTEELSLIQHLCNFLCQLETEHYSALELQQAVKRTFGRLSITVSVCAEKYQSETCVPMMVVECGVLREKRAEAEKLLAEILFRTDFSENQKEKMRELVQQTHERAKMAGVVAGQALGRGLVLAGTSAAAAARDAIGGYTHLQMLHRLPREFDERFEAFAGLMQSSAQKLFTRKRLLAASLTATEFASFDTLTAMLPEGEAAPENAVYRASYPARMGYQIPAQIGFAVQGLHLDSLGMRYRPAMRVAAKLISLSYLWNTVRVQGGAYGTGLSVGHAGYVTTFSYRDPSPANSLAANRGISDFIRTFCESPETVDKFIISTIADEDALNSAQANGAMADMLWLDGYTHEEMRALRKELLAVTKDDLLATCTLWDALAEKGTVCVCASGNLLDACGGLEILES